MGIKNKKSTKWDDYFEKKSKNKKYIIKRVSYGSDHYMSPDQYWQLVQVATKKVLIEIEGQWTREETTQDVVYSPDQKEIWELDAKDKVIAKHSIARLVEEYEKG